VALTLLAGPANAGKVTQLLEQYLEALHRDPVLIVPNRADVDRVERELLRSTGALLGGSIGTFDDVFRSIALAGEQRPVARDVQRALVVRRAIGRVSLNGLTASAASSGFAEALGNAIAELEDGLADPADLEDDLGRLYASYRVELDTLGLWDDQLLRRYAADRIASELSAWHGRPVFAYGFEDLTGAQWALLSALAARTDVAVSLPYEPGRAVFASLERTATDLARLAERRIEELPPRYDEFARPALAHVERALFDGAGAGPAPALAGAVRFLEGAGRRATLELVGAEILSLLRAGTEPEQIGVVCPSLERWRAPLETAFSTLGVPFAFAGRIRLPDTAFGHALLALLRFAWGEPRRRDLFAFLRSPYSGLQRGHVDYLEGRLRGRAVQDERVEEETVALRGGPVPLLETARTQPPLGAVAELASALLRAAYGLEAPPLTEQSKLDLRARAAVVEVVGELEGWRSLGGDVSRDDVLAALERTTVGLRANEAGCVAVVDLMRTRTRRFETVFLLGLEEGGLPRRPPVSPFLDDDERRRLESRSQRTRLREYDALARERYLFYTACTRPSRRLYLVREAANDEGSPREASPFWDEVRSLFGREEVERWTFRRPLSMLVWPLERAPSERERLRSVASLASSDVDGALALARGNGWDRQLERALAAFDRPTRLTHPALLADLRERMRFGVTELEAFADCSSIWFVDRFVSPKSIDAEVDAKLRGSVAHQALFKFFSGLPKALGVERLAPEHADAAVELVRECIAEAVGGIRQGLSELQRRELEQGLARDLEQFVREECESASPLVPRRFEVAFGSDRSAPELQRGLELGDFSLSGKIDRIDLDPFSARGIVQDYKSGKTAHSAAKIDSELRLQIPLYILVLRDLIGIEPLGGLYRALGGERPARGLLRAEAREDGLPGFMKTDYRDEDEFWGQIERAQEHARRFVERIRSGDVQHDPRGGFPCPSWCTLAPMCRVERA
jgi:ATP-dependent helicase/nuclease subunit B